jgi:hypothetical protein
MRFIPLCLSFPAFILAAQVTFSVDMSVEVALGHFEPENGSVNLTGSFNEWDYSDLSDPDGDLIYDVTLEVSIAEHAYRFSKYWGELEDIPDRQVTVTGDAVLPTVYFGDLDPAFFPEVTFRVNMSFQHELGRFDPEVHTPDACGTFSGWDVNEAFVLYDSDEDMIYERTTIVPADLHEFKYRHNSSWDYNWEQMLNRTIDATEGDVDLPVVWYGEIEPAPYKNIEAEFNLDVSLWVGSDQWQAGDEYIVELFVPFWPEYFSQFTLELNGDNHGIATIPIGNCVVGLDEVYFKYGVQREGVDIIWSLVSDIYISPTGQEEDTDGNSYSEYVLPTMLFFTGDQEIPAPEITEAYFETGDIHLAWTYELALGVIEYYVYRYTDFGGPELIATIESNSLSESYVDVGVSTPVWNHYYVSALLALDGQTTTQQSEPAEVLANNPPQITQVQDQTMLEDGEMTIPLVFLDPDGELQGIEVMAEAQAIEVEINGNNLMLQPQTDWFGGTQITITVFDEYTSSVMDFSLSVLPVNDQPIIIENQFMCEENVELELHLQAVPGPENEHDQNLDFTLLSLPPEGMLALSPGGVALDESVLPLDLGSNQLYFNHTERFYSTEINFQVQDDGGLENGGVDLSEPGNAVMTLSIIPTFSFSTTGPIESGITLLDENSIYCASSGDGVYRFNQSGSILYTLNVNGDIKSSTTISQSQDVYIASTDYNLYSFNVNGISNNGWPVSLGAQATASVALDEIGNSYIGTSNGIYQSIAPNGEVNWGYNVGGAVYASSAINNDNILYVINENGRLFSFDLSTLNPDAIVPRAIYELGEDVHASPALDTEGSLYIATLSGSLKKLQDNGASFTEIWTESLSAPMYASPVISSAGNVLIGTQGGQLHFLDTEGNQLWITDLGSAVLSTAALAEFDQPEDRAYVGSDGGVLFAISLLDGAVIWGYNAGSAVNCPILFHAGRIYFGNMNGDVVAVDDQAVLPLLSKRSDIMSVWPTFQGNNARTGSEGSIVSTHGVLLPGEFILDQNYPNPFNPSTTIRYGLPEDSNVVLIIYDIRGNTIKIIDSGSQTAGWHEHIWDGLDDSDQPVSTGLYLTRLQTDSYTNVIKMLYLK